MVNETDLNITDNWHGFVKIALSEEPYYSQVIFSIALLVIFIASLVGNVLTCIVIYSDKTMHTATNCYLFNLAVSDLLVTFPILLIIYQLLTQDSQLVQFQFGVWSCKFIICIHFLFITILWNNGIMVMTALSIERYVAICYPMMLKGTPVWRRVGKIIAIIWTVAIIETLPEFWMVDVVNTGKTLICFSLPSPYVRIISGVVAVVTFIIPLGILTFVYTMIAFKVNDDNQRNNLKGTVFNSGSKRKQVNKLIGNLDFLCTLFSLRFGGIFI